jgi:uncharacterized membrane protein
LRDPGEQVTVPELPDVLAAVTSQAEQELLAWLADPTIDADEIARRLLTGADPDHPD